MLDCLTDFAIDVQRFLEDALKSPKGSKASSVNSGMGGMLRSAAAEKLNIVFRQRFILTENQLLFLHQFSL